MVQTKTTYLPKPKLRSQPEDTLIQETILVQIFTEIQKQNIPTRTHTLLPLLKQSQWKIPPKWNPTLVSQKNSTALQELRKVLNPIKSTPVTHIGRHRLQVTQLILQGWLQKTDKLMSMRVISGVATSLVLRVIRKWDNSWNNSLRLRIVNWRISLRNRSRVRGVMESNNRNCRRALILRSWRIIR